MPSFGFALTMLMMVTLFAPSFSAAQEFELGLGGRGSSNLTNEFADHGVRFSSPRANVLWQGDTRGAPSFVRVIHMPLGPSPFSTDPIRVDFIDPLTRLPSFADRFSLRAFDGGGDEDHLFITGYDAAGQIVASTEHTTGTFGGNNSQGGVTLGLMGLPMSFVIIDVENTTSGLFFDDFSYRIVPEPGTGILIGIGLAAFSRRRPRR